MIKKIFKNDFLKFGFFGPQQAFLAKNPIFPDLRARCGPKNQNLKKSLIQIVLIIFYYNLTKFHKKTSYLSGVIFKNVILRYRGLKFNIRQKSQILGT